VLRFYITGVLPDKAGVDALDGDPKARWVLHLSLGGLASMAIAILLGNCLGRAEPRSRIGRAWRLIQHTTGMVFAWCILWAMRWEALRIEFLTEIDVEPGTIAWQVMLAMVASVFSLLLILILDMIENAAGKDGICGSTVRSVIASLSLLVGFSWQRCFAACLKALASLTPRPVIMEVAASCVVAVVVLPAWRRHILVKVLHYRQMQEVEVEPPSNTRISDGLIEYSPPSVEHDARRRAASRKGPAARDPALRSADAQRHCSSREAPLLSIAELPETSQSPRSAYDPDNAFGVASPGPEENIFDPPEQKPFSLDSSRVPSQSSSFDLASNTSDRRPVDTASNASQRNNPDLNPFDLGNNPFDLASNPPSERRPVDAASNASQRNNPFDLASNAPSGRRSVDTVSNASQRNNPFDLVSNPSERNPFDAGNPFDTDSELGSEHQLDTVNAGRGHRPVDVPPLSLAESPDRRKFGAGRGYA